MNPNEPLEQWPATILIVDDDALVREVLHDFLDSQGYQIGFAQNGYEALDKVAELLPDLILLDVMMPGMDGFEVCRHLKAHPQWRHIPIILVTALNDKQDMARGIEAGADDFLSKPVNSTELRARARSMLRIKSQYDTLERQRRELEASLHLNQKLSQVIAQHLEALEVLHDTGLRLLNNLDIDSVLNLVAQTVLDLIPEADGCVIHFLSDDKQQLLPVVFSPENRAKLVHPNLGIEKIAAHSIAGGQPVYLPDISVATQPLQPQIPNMRALLVVPLNDAGNPMGTLSAYSRQPGIFEEMHRHVLSILGRQAAVAITKAWFFRNKERTMDEEKWAIRNMFQRYVSPAVVERLVNGEEDLALGGKRQQISVLFADIRGFTGFSEKLPPEKLVETLNQYLALAVNAIMEQEGTLDKFMGDAVMAIFNAPLPQPDCTLRAVKAALTMQQAIAQYNVQATHQERLSFGIGIHLGQAVVGNIGTPQQMNYTAIGDTINLAKRLEENADGGQILLSQAAYNNVQSHVTVKDLGQLAVKGRAATEHAYQLIDLKK